MSRSKSRSDPDGNLAESNTGNNEITNEICAEAGRQ